jgi:4-diphosphocytidyl-2-C-methyl-D-erythritol kinase
MIAKTNVKINLGLHVLRKRPDGYHDIETLFVPYFEYGDTLEIVAGEDFSQTSASLFARYGQKNLAQGISEDGKLMITIARADGIGWDPLSDLTVKAYELLTEDFDLPPVKIFLEKTAPVGAGLGGGSADAAFALRMLNELFSLGLTDSLADYAVRLGSDCPFFLHNRPMIGRGRGEVLEPFDWKTEGLDLQVIIPENIFASTAEAYKGLLLRNDADRLPLRDILNRPVEEWKGLLVNDFEDTVFAAHPELAAIKQSLYESGALYASMSGSGSALFALYKA